MAKKAVKETGTLTSGQVFSYSLGDVANNLSFMMTSMFLMVYMTDIAGISAGVAGTIYGVTKIWAGVSDLVAGQTVDRANTRWGRLRPWILFGSTPLAIVFVLMFSVPAGLSPGLTVAWILLFDAAYQLAYSFVNIPYGSLSAAMTQDPVDRSKLSGSRSIASSITGVALSAVLAPQFNDTTGDGIRLQFTLTTLALGVIAVILYLICFRNTRETVPRSSGKISLKNTMSMIRQNRPLLVLCLAAFFLLASMFTMSAVGMYYARYILGNAGWFTLLMLAQSVGTIVMASFVPTITARFGKRLGYFGAAVIVVIAFVLIYFVPEGNLLMAIVAWFIYGAGSGGTNALMFAMQADTVDYGEWKTGIRSEGGSYSILSFIRKFGQGIGGWAGAAVVGAFGYLGGAEVQTDRAEEGIRIATGLLPAGLAVLAAIVIFWYNLSLDDHRKLVRELQSRRTTADVASSYGVDPQRVIAEQVGDERDLLLRPRSEGIIPVITIFELEGAGATDIGPRVAEELGVKYVPQKFTSDEVAEVDTGALFSDSAFDRWLRTVSYTGTQDSGLAQGRDIAEDNSVAMANTKELLELAKDGAVIRGRNGALVLSRVVGAVHVRLVAPLSRRVERVAAKTGLSPAEAEARIHIEDRVRAEMSRSLYQWDPNDDEYYDLVINTASVTYDQVVELIVDYYKNKYGDPKTAPVGTGSRAAGPAAGPVEADPTPARGPDPDQE